MRPERWPADDAELERELRRYAETLYHPVGTARMGTDPESVVDEQLRVRGITGLRVADASVSRRWSISSTERVNRLGRPTAYVLYPTESPTLLADASSSIAKRAEFATKHLFVTRYDPAERYAAGDFVHQNPGGDGLTAYTADDRPIDGEDIVLWHTFGPTHIPRTEDWPVMPVDYAKFTLKPYGFFSMNPALNVPPPDGAAHCSADGAALHDPADLIGHGRSHTDHHQGDHDHDDHGDHGGQR